MWTEPSTGRPLLPPPAPVAVLAREHYRVGVPPSRVEMDRAAQLARLKVLHDEVHRPTRTQLRGLKALVDSDDVLERWHGACARAARVEGQVRAWRRGAGRKASLPLSLSKARDSAADEHVAAWSAVKAVEAALVAALPRPTLAQLRSMRSQVHRAASRPVRGRMAAAGGVGRVSPPVAGSAAQQAAARVRFAREEHRRIVNEFYGAARLVAATRDRPAEHRAALVATASLRAEAAALHPVLLGVG